jgi:hypothetical protein
MLNIDIALKIDFIPMEYEFDPCGLKKCLTTDKIKFLMNLQVH